MGPGECIGKRNVLPNREVGIGCQTIEGRWRQAYERRGRFLDDVMSRLGKAGFDLVTVVDAMPGGQPFGDAVVVFRVDEVLLRIVRDRSEIFVDVGSTFAPAQFYQ